MNNEQKAYYLRGIQDALDLSALEIRKLSSDPETCDYTIDCCVDAISMDTVKASSLVAKTKATAVTTTFGEIRRAKDSAECRAVAKASLLNKGKIVRLGMSFNAPRSTMDSMMEFGLINSYAEVINEC